MDSRKSYCFKCGSQINKGIICKMCYGDKEDINSLNIVLIDYKHDSNLLRIEVVANIKEMGDISGWIEIRSEDGKIGDNPEFVFVSDEIKVYALDILEMVKNEYPDLKV